jgi:beta-galactosidase
VHIVHNWSWLAAHVKTPLRLVDALDGSSLPTGSQLNLGPWDVRVFFTG